MERLDIAEIEILTAAVRTGSLSAAARQLGISQQAVSSRLRECERRIGIELLQRSSTGVRLTAAGATIHTSAVAVLGAVSRMSEEIAALRGSAGSALAIAASQTIAAHALPRWLNGLRRRQLDSGRTPTATALHTDNSRGVIQRVRDGVADVGFIETPHVPTMLGSTIVQWDGLVVAVAENHPWSSRASVGLAELADAALVTREKGSGTRDAFEVAVRRLLGRRPEEPITVLATEAAVRSAVIEGVGAAVLSELTIHDDVRLGRVRAIAIDPDVVTRPFTAIWRGSERDLYGAARELVEVALGRI